VRDALARLRRFNRLLTRRIGLLGDRYLDSPLPFAEARLLYELALLAPLGTHHLQRLLDVDRAQMSRGLASLESRGFVRRRGDPGDRRKRIVDVSARGRRLLASLDVRADARAASMIDGLPARERRRLVGAVDEARRLLVGAALRIEGRPDRDLDVAAAQAAYLSEIARRFGRSLDRWNQGPIAPARSLVVVDAARPVGCGVLRELADGLGEIKRMWLHPDVRGLGVGTRLLDRLEAAAREAGHREIRLHTNERLTEAIALYERAGYRRIGRYNDNPDATRFYAKRLWRGGKVRTPV
jgi:DNA-binding MarR family transcriptional regulator/RimJ/RimL family protein N-acetyltransferase